LNPSTFSFGGSSHAVRPNPLAHSWVVRATIICGILPPQETFSTYQEALMADALGELAANIAASLPDADGGLRPKIEALFGDRYEKRHFAPTCLRDSYAFASGTEDRPPYAGLLHPDNATSGPSFGFSVVWFATAAGSLITFGVGRLGLAADEGILMGLGHPSRIAALPHYLARHDVDCWSRPPAALGGSVPKTASDRFPGFEKIFQRYGNEMYACARVPSDPVRARSVVQAFLDLYAYERGWTIMKAHEEEYDTFHAALRSDLFAAPTVE
jgi:hypothetical protein